MRFFGLVTSTIFLAINSSCNTVDLSKSNDIFTKKYGEQTKKINETRKPDPIQKNQRTSSSPPTSQEVTEQLANKAYFYPYTGITKIGDAPKFINLPDQEIYEFSQANNPNSLPPDIFEPPYNLALYPPFQKIGAEFDVIKIPNRDRFGVNTELSSKEYLLVGNNSLQRSIDKINSSKTQLDIDVSKMLIFEKNKMRRNQGNGAVEEVFFDKKEDLPSREGIKVKEDIKPKNLGEKISGFIRSTINSDSSK